MEQQPLSTDLMVGAGPIARFTGLPERKIFYMLQSGMLPAFKIGRLWCARKSTLERFIVEREQAARGSSRTAA